MADFITSTDGTILAAHRTGEGEPLVVVPGGPMRASAYLGDLGGLIHEHPAVLLDLRGTGESAVPADPASYRCDRQAEDVEALRRHLGQDRIDLAGHSAGAAVALHYAARHPDRVRRLLLVTPSPRAAGLDVSDADRRRVADLRRGEPWFDDASAALDRIQADADTDADWDAITPFSYGRWDEHARAHAAGQDREQNGDAVGHYYADAPAAALAGIPAPTLIVGGEHDLVLPPPQAKQYAELFADAQTVIQPAAGHYPWLDDPAGFLRVALGFLR